MNNKLYQKYLITVLLLITTSHVIAQQDKIEAQIPRISGTNRVYLKNQYDYSLTVFLSYNGINWYQESLIPKSVTPYRVNSNFHIKVFTSTKDSIQYPLTPNEKYSIEWDDKNKKWDVYHIVNSNK
jgi:hypothetical protein